MQVASAQAVNLFVSCLTLVLIALDRFLLTLCPVKWRLAARAPLAFYLGVWLCSLLVAFPYFFAVHTETVDGFQPWNQPNIDDIVSATLWRSFWSAAAEPTFGRLGWDSRVTLFKNR